MTYKEPKEMAELHKIREELSKECANQSAGQINRKLIQRTSRLSSRLKLPHETTVLKSVSTKTR
ncbi:MAG: hypothetical protein QME51_11150 [Planctomycetota bacterium]|nr:hypothetical protein [Planctomycetota bacterium]